MPVLGKTPVQLHTLDLHDRVWVKLRNANDGRPLKARSGCSACSDRLFGCESCSTVPDLIFESAASLAAGIRARRVSAVEVVDAHLTRIAAVNPQLNAVVQLSADTARAEARAADEDLGRQLRLRAEARSEEGPAGALLFACNGRGAAMFGACDHDAVAVDEALGGAPAAGFFAAGEIGPVGGRSFLHGFTATVAVFPR